MGVCMFGLCNVWVCICGLCNVCVFVCVCGFNAVNIFISTVLRLLYLRSRHSSILTFANVSTDSELTLQCDIECADKKSELMKLRSVGI